VARQPGGTSPYRRLTAYKTRLGVRISARREKNRNKNRRRVQGVGKTKGGEYKDPFRHEQHRTSGDRATIKVALRRLRKFARERGAPETNSTSTQPCAGPTRPTKGYLDIHLRPRKGGANTVRS